MVRRYPESSALVLFDGGDTVVCQSRLNGQSVLFALLQVVAEQAVVCADIEHAVEFTRNTDRCTVVDAVLAKGAEPALCLDVQRTDAQGRGNVDALAVRRERELRDIVVDNTVDFAVVRGFLVL